MLNGFDFLGFGPDQVPFRYDRPAWLASLEPEVGELSSTWRRLVAYVANTANESGYFMPSHVGWLLWSGYTEVGSLDLAERFERAGGLTRLDGRWYVVDWRDVYRVPASA